MTNDKWRTAPRLRSSFRHSSFVIFYHQITAGDALGRCGATLNCYLGGAPPSVFLRVMKKLFAEFLGAFGLVFAGTGAIVIDDQTGALGHPGIALTFGLIVLA